MKTYQNNTPLELLEMTDGKTLSQLQKELEYQQSMGETLGGNICSHIVYMMEKLRAKSALLPIMRTELTDKEIKQLEREILAHFNSNPRFDRHNKMVRCRSISALNDYLGLAYTSSSSWAMLGICNEAVYLDHAKTYQYQAFGYDMGGFAVAWLSDNEENELYIFI